MHAYTYVLISFLYIVIYASWFKIKGESSTHTDRFFSSYRDVSILYAII